MELTHVWIIVSHTPTSIFFPGSAYSSREAAEQASIKAETELAAANAKFNQTTRREIVRLEIKHLMPEWPQL